ncbi:hypothetical protein NVS55_02100 [Myxococcus stipitatus]|uniref:hypothetical protein n=1 Tax=Myxococcus stipitatus TaxID=83455 RepID=UPI00314569A7
MAHWKRLQKLNGGDAILYLDPRLDTKDEVWFSSADGEPRVWSNGTLFKHDRKALKSSSPVSARSSLFLLKSDLFVDVEVRGSEAVVRRGLLNGSHNVTRIDADEVEALLARYRELGFRDGTPWNATRDLVTLREYRKGASSSSRWTLKVDDTTTVEDSRKVTSHPDRDTAIAHANKRILAREKAGYILSNLELADADHANPTPKPAKGAPKRTALAKAPRFDKPRDAFEAVDTSVAMLKSLHERIPMLHLLVELMDTKQDAQRLDDVVPHVAFFTRLHKRRLGRWRKAKPGTPKKGESSWQYFLRVYGSITWILGENVDKGLPGFPCGNVSGGGWSCLEVGDDIYDIRGLVQATRNPALRHLEVFHGGWHTGRAFAFDSRSVSATGERAIHPFDEGTPTLPKEMRPERIQPFGLWLHQHVTRLLRIAERNLRERL